MMILLLHLLFKFSFFHQLSHGGKKQSKTKKTFGCLRNMVGVCCSVGGAVVFLVAKGAAAIVFMIVGFEGMGRIYTGVVVWLLHNGGTSI